MRPNWLEHSTSFSERRDEALEQKVFVFVRGPPAVSSPPADGRPERAMTATGMDGLHDIPSAWPCSALTASGVVADVSANTLDPELAFDSERLAQPMGLHLLRNAGLSCICIRLSVRPNV